VDKKCLTLSKENQRNPFKHIQFGRSKSPVKGLKQSADSVTPENNDKFMKVSPKSMIYHFLVDKFSIIENCDDFDEKKIQKSLNKHTNTY
jgi:hypothetical protein